MKKRTYIVSKYNSYEWINTEDAYCALFLKLKLWREGWKPFVINPPLWLAVKLSEWFGWRTLRETDVTVEYLDNTKDQVTHHSPYDHI